ncbi:unnamed protein product [Dracunculus medinensis]|uniref:SERPIN domain-containing protein n=1 Tax=Dracunculus medinensis TaxID=318479 RepID=A0A0N4UBR6_DRAME|nr:unnamed protein product [Dracunculus medinensis]
MSGIQNLSIKYSIFRNKSMVGVAITSVKFEWVEQKVKNASNRPFLLHYGVKAPKASYISLKGPMRIHSNKYIESIGIPLKIAKELNEGLAENKRNFMLILVRPRNKGAITDLKTNFTGTLANEIINTIKIKSADIYNILIPKLTLPNNCNQKKLDDTLFHWNSFLQIWNQPEFNEISDGISFDHFYHFAYFSISNDGIGFDDFHSVDLPSEHTQNSENGQQFQPYKEAYNICFDSPFLFLIVELHYNIPLIIGSYAGEPALLKSQTRKYRKKEVICCLC